MLNRCLLLAMCTVALGCGSGGPFDYVEVSGTITYDDGTPIPGGCRLVFTAQDVAAVGNAHPRPGMAKTNAEGVFDCVTSYKHCDGLIPGKHKVTVQSTAERDGEPVVPKEYASALTTPLVVDTADAPFQIKVPKPAGNRQ
jgi:hypothetical protein